MRRWSVLVALMAAVTSPWVAGGQIVLPSASATRIDARWSTVTLRRNRAIEWLRAFRQLDSQVPALSPAEERWLKTEVDDESARSSDRYTPRALTAMDSREYQIRVVRPRVSNILATLDVLSSSSQLSSAMEVRLWAALAAEFMDVSLWQAVDRLAQLQVIQPEVNGTKLYLANHVLWAQDILTAFVIPSLPR